MCVFSLLFISLNNIIYLSNRIYVVYIYIYIYSLERERKITTTILYFNNIFLFHYSNHQQYWVVLLMLIQNIVKSIFLKLTDYKNK